MNDLKRDLGAHLDALMPSQAELADDLDAVLARRRRRRSFVAFAIGVPGLVAAAAAVFFVVRADPVVVDGNDVAVHVYVGDPKAPDDALVIDFQLTHPTTGH